MSHKFLQKKKMMLPTYIMEQPAAMKLKDACSLGEQI